MYTWKVVLLFGDVYAIPTRICEQHMTGVV